MGLGAKRAFRDQIISEDQPTRLGKGPGDGALLGGSNTTPAACDKIANGGAKTRNFIYQE